LKLQQFPAFSLEFFFKYSDNLLSFRDIASDELYSFIDIRGRIISVLFNHYRTNQLPNDTRRLEDLELFLDGLNLERKLINKKLKALREDKKADPNNVLKQEALIADIDEKKSRVVLNNVRLKAVKCTSISEFINDPNIDLDALYKQRLPALKIALGMVKQK
jgi:TRAP-type mannitol/chloroaromatic compound transport system substrate-binding protein